MVTRRSGRRRGRFSRHRSRRYKGRRKRYSRRARHSRRARRRRMRGGYATNTMLPSFLVNGARSALTGTENIVNTYKGKPLISSPYPTVQTNLSPLEDIWLPKFPDLSKISAASAEAAASM